jgi:hypothetical protein
MYPVCAIRWAASILIGLAAGVLTVATAAPAALAGPWPPSVTPTAPATMRPPPPGWKNHRPLPAHLHSLATSGIPGWQLTLMAVTIVLLVATLVAIAYPGPGRPAAGGRPYRLSDDRIRRCADDPQEQPQASDRTRPTGQATMASPDGSSRTKQQPRTWRPASTGPAPSTMMPQRHTKAAPGLHPHTVQLCLCCRQNPAGFWVSRTSDQTMRRPYCLFCCQRLDQSRYHVIPFDSHSDTGRMR